MMFEPLGEKSRREIVYEALRDSPSDEAIPYERLPFEREVVMGLREDVARLFEREQQRTVVCIRGVGWMIRRGVEQVEVATKKRRQATRRMGRALQVVESADRREMSAQDRLRADAELITTRTSYGLLRGLAVKAPRLGVEDVVRAQEERERQ